MNKIYEDKILKKINGSKKDNNSNVSKYFKGLLLRILVCIILFLIIGIMVKSNDEFKKKIYNNIFNSSLSFTSFKNFYNKYLGGIVPIENLDNDTEMVFNEKLQYLDKSKYVDGVKLEVSSNYLVPILESGLVVYIGEKENYNNVVIIQGMDGIDLWYGNMLTTSVSMYDYVEEGDMLGETDGNELYLVYSQNGKYLDYEEYLD